MVAKISIYPEIYKWAIEESQLPIEEIRNRFPAIESWIDSSAQPTFIQLSNFADFLHVPFGYMFLDAPPEKDHLHAEFRAIANKKPLMSKNLEDTLFEMTLKQGWMREFRESQGWEPLDFINRFPNGTYKEIKLFINTLLGVKEYWSEKAKTYEEAFNVLKNRLGDIGVLVMQNGVVGTNTHRKLDIHEFRGFVLLDPFAPLIFINSNDSKSGKIFTLLHEFIHLLMGDEDILDHSDENLSQQGRETTINEITSLVLIPDNVIDGLAFSNDKFFYEIKKIATMLKVSPLSLAIRLKRKGEITQSQLELIKQESIENFETYVGKERIGKPDFIRVHNSRLSSSFSEAVISQTLAGHLPYTEAYSLLGIRGKTFDKFIDHLKSYG